MTKSVAEIHNEAIVAAKLAAHDMFERIGGDRYACGFAWCELRGVKLNTKVGKEFAKLGFEKGYGRGAGIQLWDPSNSNVQNVDIKEAGAKAYAKVFRDYGFDAYACSRLD